VLLSGEVGFPNMSFGGGPEAQVLLRQQSRVAVSLAGRDHWPHARRAAAVWGSGTQGPLPAKRDRTSCHRLARTFKELPL